MSNTAPSHASDSDHLALRDQRRAGIVAGDIYPSRFDRLTGMPPFRDSVLADLRYLAELELARDRLPAATAAAMEKLAAAPGRWTAAAVRTALVDGESIGWRDVEVILTLDFCLALLGDEHSRHRIIEECVRYSHSTLSRPFAFQLALGLAAQHPADVETEYSPGDHADLMQIGRVRLETTMETWSRVVLARAMETGEAQDRRQDAIDAMLEDRSDTFVDPGPRSLQPRQTVTPLGLVVVPTLPAAGGGARKDLYKSWEGLAGKPLPLIQARDVVQQFGDLISRWPHAAETIETILRDLSSRNAVRLRPTLLVGSPGSGKSALAVAIAQVLGLPFELHSLAGSSDSSAMGTSAQWYSARESVVLQLIKRTKVANPAVIWDEVDKGGESRHNGSVLDVLLGLLERDQAASYRDLALEVPVNLSMVSHLATANDLETVPAPLRDRFRILHVPEPQWQHAGVLVRGIVERIAADREIDPRWIGSLAPDEMELVRRAWPGGSIRQLERIVGVIVDGRDQVMGRA